MTYAQFLGVFLLPPIALLLIPYWRRPSEVRPWFTWGALLLIGLAVTYTTPWDNYLVATGVWNYPPERILGTIGYVPIEEYIFFVLQTVLTSLWCYWLQFRWPVREEAAGGPAFRWIGAIPLVAIWVSSLWMLNNEPTKYMGLILVWATPVVLLQWCVAAPFLPRNWRLALTTIAVPTLYLWAADLFAIGDGIWSISPTQTTGWMLFGLPIEEALFFLLTNVMVGQGLILFVAMRKPIAFFMASRRLRV